MNNSFQTPSLKPHLDKTNGSKIVILRATHLLTQREIPSNVQWLNLRSRLDREGEDARRKHKKTRLFRTLDFTIQPNTVVSYLAEKVLCSAIAFDYPGTVTRDDVRANHTGM